MKEVSDKSGVMGDVVDRLLHWSLPAIRSEFGDGVASRIERTLPVGSRADVFRLGAGGDDSIADAEDDGEHEGEGSGRGNGGSFCGSDDSVPRSGHGSQRGRRSRGRPPSRGRSRSRFEHVRPLCWDDSRDGALQSGPCNNRSKDVLKSMGHWGSSKAPDVILVEPLERLGIEWQKDCHHKVKNIRKALRKVVTLKVPKKLNNPHQCVSESQLMQFTKKELLDALTDRYGPGSLTAKEERLKKSDFVALVMSKMYPYGTMKNNKSLVVDADGVTEFHMDEVGHWFLRASQLCRDEGSDFVTLHNDVMMIVDHWAGDHSRCVADRELLCLKAGDPSRLPLYTHDDPVYDIIRQTLDRHCSTTVCLYYTEFRHTSTVETFQGTIIIYAKKALHFEKSYEPRLAIAVIRWNSHAWQDPLEYRVRRPSRTSIRPRPSHYRHNRPPTDSWMDRLSTFIFGSKCVSDWARRVLEYDDCDVSGEVGSSTPPLPRDLFCRGEDTIVRDENDVASGANPDIVGDDDVFIIGDGDGLPGPADAVFDRSCNSLSDADDVELFDD
ncbi:hypothetical protein CBR_g34490 [Chara braunii]|uniref:Uncharacterized protein n=1 Tax=Chara braunii TaxID=69332 RepID=A0A388LIW3_CHABU|nr:hypothetical protein CBR_g34490 [Chara braunii]|eukprot:GBG82207.1 hypothetical protein CBR_g34490 [Chara braunii]